MPPCAGTDPCSRPARPSASAMTRRQKLGSGQIHAPDGGAQIQQHLRRAHLRARPRGRRSSPRSRSSSSGCATSQAERTGEARLHLALGHPHVELMDRSGPAQLDDRGTAPRARSAARPLPTTSAVPNAGLAYTWRRPRTHWSTTPWRVNSKRSCRLSKPSRLIWTEPPGARRPEVTRSRTGSRYSLRHTSHASVRDASAGSVARAASAKTALPVACEDCRPSMIGKSSPRWGSNSVTCGPFWIVLGPVRCGARRVSVPAHCVGTAPTRAVTPQSPGGSPPRGSAAGVDRALVEVDGDPRDRVPAELPDRPGPARRGPSPRPAGSATSAFTASARLASKASGSSRRSAPAARSRRRSTTSGMPPTSLATTAAPQAIASRLTMPSGSYTDGQTKTVDADSTCTTRAGSACRRTRTRPRRCACSSAIAGRRLGADLRGVRRAGAEHQLDASGSKWLGRRDQVADALLPGDPADERARIGASRSTPLSTPARRRSSVGLVDLGVDAVVDDVHLVRVQRRVAVQDVGSSCRWRPR